MDDYEWKLIVQTRDEKGRWASAGGKAFVRKYNPNQPRDERGRWASTGSAAPPLKQYFDNAKDARRWLEDEFAHGGRSMDGLYDLSDEQTVEAANTIRDIYEKVPTRWSVNHLVFEAGEPSMYSPRKRVVYVDQTSKPAASTERTLSFLNRELEYLEGRGHKDTPYMKELKTWKTALKSGDYLKAHSLYWFGDERQMEAILRHEYGHGFHEVYREGNIYGDPGIDNLQRTSKNWKKDYGITLRGTDNWGECVAENFVAWSMGRTDLMNPKMVETFDTLVRIKE